MSCNCKHMQAEIKEGYKVIGELRELFIKRMTVPSVTRDRRRNDYNKPIFTNIDGNGKFRTLYVRMDMDMVLQCFDDAVKDWRKTFCDNDKCRERKVPKED